MLLEDTGTVAGAPLLTTDAHSSEGSDLMGASSLLPSWFDDSFPEPATDDPLLPAEQQKTVKFLWKKLVHI